MTDFPAEWHSVRIGGLFRRREERGRSDLPLLSVYRDFGVVPRKGRDDNFNRPGEDLDAYRVVRPGDLVVNKMKTWQGSLGISAHEGIVSPAYFVATQVNEADGRFLHHLFRSRPLIAEYGARSKGIRPSQWDLPWDEFKDIRIALPPIEEQRAIADFLDRETARIDALITKKRSLAAKARERFRSFVHHTVMGGASDNKRVRETGNAFLPRVPDHWLLVPLRYRWNVIDCKHRNPEFRKEGYPILGPTDLKPARLDLSTVRRFVDEADFLDLAEGERRVKRGDIIYTRNASIGTATYVDIDKLFTMGQDQCLITSTDQDQLFLFYFLNWAAVDQLDAIKIGATFSRINIDQIKQIIVPVPPPEEQRDISSRLDQGAAHLDALTDTVSRQLGLLIRRKQALTTAAVTGQIEISSAA